MWFRSAKALGLHLLGQVNVVVGTTDTERSSWAAAGWCGLRGPAPGGLRAPVQLSWSGIQRRPRGQGLSAVAMSAIHPAVHRSYAASTLSK
jgi:hypothetical protein